MPCSTEDLAHPPRPCGSSGVALSFRAKEHRDASGNTVTSHCETASRVIYAPFQTVVYTVLGYRVHASRSLLDQHLGI